MTDIEQLQVYLNFYAPITGTEIEVNGVIDEPTFLLLSRVAPVLGAQPVFADWYNSVKTLLDPWGSSPDNLSRAIQADSEILANINKVVMQGAGILGLTGGEQIDITEHHIPDVPEPPPGPLSVDGFDWWMALAVGALLVAGIYLARKDM